MSLAFVKFHYTLGSLRNKAENNNKRLSISTVMSIDFEDIFHSF